MELHLQDLRADYVKLVQMVINEGYPVEVRGLETRELPSVRLLLDPQSCTLPLGTNRGVSLPFAAAETLDIIAGQSHPTYYDVAAPGWRDVLIDKSDAAVRYAAYGPRIKDQLPKVVLALHQGTTRSAILQIWRPEDLDWQGDRPCTMFLQFLLRDGELDLHVHMRSQDVWLGTPYDVFAFTQLQMTIAKLVGARPGAYVHDLGSLHVYERNVPEAQRLHDPGKQRESLPKGLTVLPGNRWESVRQRAADLLYYSHPELSAATHNDRWYVEQVGKIRARL